MPDFGLRRIQRKRDRDILALSLHSPFTLWFFRGKSVAWRSGRSCCQSHDRVGTWTAGRRTPGRGRRGPQKANWICQEMDRITARWGSAGKVGGRDAARGRDGEVPLRSTRVDVTPVTSPGHAVTVDGGLVRIPAPAHGPLSKCPCLGPLPPA